MINAKEARKITDESDAMVMKTLAAIEPKIREAAMSGKCDVECYNSAVGIPTEDGGVRIMATSHDLAVVRALTNHGYSAKFGKVGRPFIPALEHQPVQQYGYLISW